LKKAALLAFALGTALNLVAVNPLFAAASQHAAGPCSRQAMRKTSSAIRCRRCFAAIVRPLDHFNGAQTFMPDLSSGEAGVPPG
jgi:hypothetical protein